MVQFSSSISRRLKLPNSASDAQIDHLIELLAGSGVTEFRVSHHRLRLSYDVTEVQWPHIRQFLKTSGLSDQMGRMYRYLDAWYAYVDENALKNISSKDSHCCNKPPSVSKRRY